MKDISYKVGKSNLILVVIFLTVSIPVVAQKVAQIPRDTSFTVFSAYQKEKKKFPNIAIVRPADFDADRWDKDVIYRTIKKTKYGKRDLHLDVFHPVDDQAVHPAIIMIHGGGWSSGNKSHMFPMAQKFADAGYVAIAVEYRLSDEAIFPAAVMDIRNAVHWLRSHYKELSVDTGKIAMLGCSAGAQLAGLVAVTQHVEDLGGRSGDYAKVHAVISMDGIVSFIHPEASAESTSASRWLGGTRVTNMENWRKASTLEYVNKDTPSFGFINSSIPRFHAGRDDMIERLNELGIYSEVHTIPDTPHPFWLFHPWFETAFDYALVYLNKVFDR